MATRKLQFKAKPILGSRISRPAQDSEILEPTTSTENVPRTAKVAAATESGESDTGKTILSSKHSETEKNVHSDVPITVESKKEVLSGAGLPQCAIQGDAPVPNNADIIEKTLPLVTTVEKNLQEANSSGCSPPLQNSNTSSEINKIEIGNNNLKSNSVSERGDILKGLSRFGRSRCKPVLTSVPRRNAAKVPNDEPRSETAPVSGRTESVIKSLRSELSKTSEKNESEKNDLSKPPDEDLNHDEDGNSCANGAKIKDIGTKESGSSTLRLASDETKDISDSSLLKHKQSNKDTKSSDAIISISCQTAIPNQPIEAVAQSIHNSGIDIPNQYIESVLQPNERSQNEVPNRPIEAVSDHIGNSKELECSNPIKNLKTPIVLLSPLRASSKILVPKPSPRLRDGIRRISFQGSDSEEDLKKKKDAIDSNDNDKKSNVKMTRKRKKTQGSTYSKMGEETLEKFYKKFGKGQKPDKSKLTMMDLIFYNPKDNPMSKTQPKTTSASKIETKTDVSEEVSETLAEQSVDDVEPTSAAVPVPQLKIGPDGQIILDPKSLVIETTGTQKSRKELEKSQVIQESGITRYSTYSKKKPRRSDWTSVETLQFYKALNTIGPDFTLMTQLFPKRNRHELKLKFKKEDRLNRLLVDKAMTGQVDFDFKTLQEELKQENEEIEKKRLEREHQLQQKKEERLKAIAEKKHKGGKRENKKHKRRRTACSIEILDTDEDSTEEQSEIFRQAALAKWPKTRRSVHKKLKKSVFEDESEDMDDESHEEDKPKKSRKLNEYHEMNESLKIIKKFPDSDLEDRYTPNGTDVHCLFRSPPRMEEQGDIDQWDIDVASAPSIEETVLQNNIETVSEISELGSFGQDSDIVLDLSVTDRTLEHRPYLDRRIITESIAIVDQLSSHVDDKLCMEKTDLLENEQAAEKILPLPSFENVMPFFRCPVETAGIIAPSEVNDEARVKIRTSNEDFEVSNDQDQSEIIIGD